MRDLIKVWEMRPGSAVDYSEGGMNRADEPAFPCDPADCYGHPATQGTGRGLTKRELVCIELRLPETGDSELDQLIAKAQRRDFAGKAMQGMQAANIENGHQCIMGVNEIAQEAVRQAVALLAELEKSEGRYE